MIWSSTQWIQAITLWLVAGLLTDVMAQEPAGRGASAGTLEEESFELIDDEEAAAIAAERFSWLRENPIDLNSAQRDELQSIPGVTAEDADAILWLRESGGRLLSLQEIHRLSGGDELLARIYPYVFVRPPGPAGSSGRFPELVLSSRLSGIIPATAMSSAGATPGGPLRSLSRFAFSFTRNVKAGLLFEKDAWEMPRDGFVSGYVSYRGNGVLEQAVLGDYTAEVGLGLVLWRGSDMRTIGVLIEGIRKAGARIVPYHLADEYHYLRGGAVVLKARLWTIPLRCLLLLSRTSLGASVSMQGVVTSFYTSGLYRTDSEMEKRNGVHEFLKGVRFESGVRGKTTIGLTYFHSAFDRMVKPASSFGFSGRSLGIGGGDFSTTIGDVTLQGEYARTAEGGTAWTTGAAIKVDSTVRGSVTWRDYSADFHNPHANGYGMQSNSSNERGITVGWSVRLAKALALHGYTDQCKIPTSTYVSLLPRTASDFMIEVTAIPKVGVRLSLAFRTRKSEIMQAGEDNPSRAASIQGYRERSTLRFTGRMEVSSHVEAKVRIERVISRLTGSHKEGDGDMVSQSFSWDIAGMEWEGGATFFEADSYDARLYDYEGNLRGSMQSPPLFGRGSRWHLVYTWNSLSWVRLAAKYVVMLIEKNPVVKELGVQVELHF